MWLVISVGDGEAHIVPHNDLIEHTEDEDCVCGPKITELDDGSRLYMHASLDGREVEYT